MAENEDKASDAEDLRPIVEGLVQAIQTLAGELDAVKGSHGKLESLVVDDLIGGIHSMYKTNMRNGRIESLKSKYGDMLNPHFEALGHLVPEGTDHWGALHDMTEGMPDEELDGHIVGLAGGLKEKLDKIRGAGAMPAAAKVEETTVIPAEAEPAKESKAETPAKEAAEPAVKSKDELIAERMKGSKGFKLK